MSKLGNSFEWFDNHYNLYGYINKKLNSAREYAYYGTINGLWEQEFKTYEEAKKVSLCKLSEIVTELKLKQNERKD